MSGGRQALFPQQQPDTREADVGGRPARSAWNAMRKLQAKRAFVSVTVIEVKPNGLAVMYEDRPGFIFTDKLGSLAKENRDSLVGSKLHARFYNIDEAKKNLHFQLVDPPSATADPLPGVADFQDGQVARGYVRSLTPFGAFVDLGYGVSGLLHISQISKERVESIDVLEVGEELQVMILRADSQGRLVLSTKLLEPYPGAMLKERGMMFEKAQETADAIAVGRATADKRVREAGPPPMAATQLEKAQEDASGDQATAWAEMRQMMEGNVVVRVLVLSANAGGLSVTFKGRRAFMPKSMSGSLLTDGGEAALGQLVSAQFVDVNEAEAALTFKSCASAEARQKVQVGQVLKGTVQYVKVYGAFVDLGEGVVGMLRVSQLSAKLIPDVRDVLREGMELKVLVYAVVDEKVSLSTKKLEPTKGDMVTNPQLVFDKAEEMGQRFRNRMAQAASGKRRA